MKKVLKCSIEMKGCHFSFGHNISKTYAEYCQAGWQEVRELELMAGTITDWEVGSRCKKLFYATLGQLQTAIEIYEVLEQRLVNYLEESA